MTPTSGRLLVISGPSGSGKTSIINRLREHPQVAVSVSVTTRPKRANEVDGRDYTFVDLERFRELNDQGAFVETNDVFGNHNLYGSLRSELEQALAGPDGVYIMELDVVGARNVRAAGYDGLHVFIAPPSDAVLEQRLRDRGTDDETAIETRLSRAAEERQIAEAEHATIIVNHDIGEAAAQVFDLLGLPV